MKKIFELVKPLTAVLFLCIAGTLLSGCYSVMPLMMMPDSKLYDNNPKTLGVDEAWINKFAKRNKTKDVDILHKLCKPTHIFQYSNGEKSYTYISVKDNGSLQFNTVTFLFNQSNTLKRTFFKENSEYGLIPYIQHDILMTSWGDNVNKLLKKGKEYRTIHDEKYGKNPPDEDLLALLETLPRNPTQQTLKKILGKPTRIYDDIMIYSYKGVTTKDDVRYILFKIKSNGRVEYMIIPKTFHDFTKKKHARVNVKTIYVTEGEINEEEATAIGNCEK